MRLLLFLSALLTGLTGLLPGAGALNARQVAQAQAMAQAVAIRVAVVATEAPTAARARPAQPLAQYAGPVFLAPAPHVDVRDRTLRTHE